MNHKSLVEEDNIANDRQRLKQLLKDSLIFKEITLSSGKKSNYYLDARLITLSAEGSLLIGRVLLEFLTEYKVKAIGGLTLGADPIAAAVSALSSIEDMPINAFIVRKETKAHGTGRQVEGPSIKGLDVAVVDDVVTSGNSLLQAAEAVKAAGANVVITTAIVDRMEGTKETIEQAGFKFEPIFTIKELL